MNKRDEKCLDKPIEDHIERNIIHSVSDRRSLLRNASIAGILGYLPSVFAGGCQTSSLPESSAQPNPAAETSRVRLNKNFRKNPPELIWGKLGLADGRFQKPRAMTIDRHDNLYIVDKTGRVQVFDRDGNFLRKWRTPDITHGKPTGLGINKDGLLMVADTHYFQVLFYTLEGIMLPEKTIGGSHGPEIGQFAFVTDVVQDQDGNYFISEYGEYDRIQKFTSDGEFICRFGETGDKPLQFSRPQSMAIDNSGNLWVSDACNHRIQIIRCTEDRPELLKIVGGAGSKLGEFRYPYGIHLGTDRSLYVAEFGNHRVQKLSIDSEPICSWGSAGRNPGHLDQPWTLTQDSLGRIHILDSGNNRVQRVDLT